MGGVRRESGGWRLEAPMDASTHLRKPPPAARDTRYERREEPASSGVEKRYALALGHRAKQSQLGGSRREALVDTSTRAAAEVIVRNKANFGVCGLPMGGRTGIITCLSEFGLAMDNPW